MKKHFVQQHPNNARYKYHESLFAFDAAKVAHVALIVFHEDGRILTIRNVRSYDIPTGPVEWDDEDFFVSASRIALEEANVELGQLNVSTVIEIFHEATTDLISLTLVITGKVVSTLPYLYFQKIRRRAYLKKDIFLERYDVRDREVLKDLIDMAEFALVQEAQDSAMSKAVSAQ